VVLLIDTSSIAPFSLPRRTCRTEKRQPSSLPLL
jgi:hypothetical protein